MEQLLRSVFPGLMDQILVEGKMPTMRVLIGHLLFEGRMPSVRILVDQVLNGGSMPLRFSSRCQPESRTRKRRSWDRGHPALDTYGARPWRYGVAQQPVQSSETDGLYHSPS